MQSILHAMAKVTKIDDKRIEAIPLLIEKGYITTWQDIFEYLPRTVLASHLGINNNRMKEYVEVPAKMPADKRDQLAFFFGVECTVIEALARKTKAAKKTKKK